MFYIYVKVKNNVDADSITANKVYKVKDVSYTDTIGKSYLLCNDRGYDCWYDADNFNTVPKPE